MQVPAKQLLVSLRAQWVNTPGAFVGTISVHPTESVQRLTVTLFGETASQSNR